MRLILEMSFVWFLESADSFILGQKSNLALYCYFRVLAILSVEITTRVVVIYKLQLTSHLKR